MSNVLKFASITKKITLATIGLFLMVFLLVHLGINLCMLRSDGGEWFRAAAHFMGTNYIIKVFEIVLFAAIILHIGLGIFLQLQNWLARPVRYASSSKTKTAIGSRFMIHTGILVLLFLGLHMVNFYFAKMGWVEGKYLVELKDVQTADISKMDQERLIALFTNPNEAERAYRPLKEVADNISKEDLTATFGHEFKAYEPDFYTMARELFSNPWAVMVYIVLLIALAIHLNHAFQSAFQTLGLANKTYTPTIKMISSVYAAIIAVGFIIIPLFFYFNL